MLCSRTELELRNVGDVVWFEYHCWESPESSDAEIWYRSHQKVTKRQNLTASLGMMVIGAMPLLLMQDVS